jgi:hypothetical protein
MPDHEILFGRFGKPFHKKRIPRDKYDDEDDFFDDNSEDDNDSNEDNNDEFDE